MTNLWPTEDDRIEKLRANVMYHEAMVIQAETALRIRKAELNISLHRLAEAEGSPITLETKPS
jgi:hypothetical protein